MQVFWGARLGDPSSAPQGQSQGTGPCSMSPPFRQASRRAAEPPGARTEQELREMLRITKPTVWDGSVCSPQRAVHSGRTTLRGDTGVLPGAGGIPKIPLLSRAGGSGGVTVLPGRRYPAGQRLRGCCWPARAKLEQGFVPARGQRGGEMLPGGGLCPPGAGHPRISSRVEAARRGAARFPFSEDHPPRGGSSRFLIVRALKQEAD